jgi:hypothetical protein
MWQYRVIHSFSDLQDGGYIYHVGDIYPRHGLTVSKARCVELKTEKNKIGKPLIKAERVKKDAVD